MDETLVTIHVNPYFLRLNFSKPVLEDDSSSAQYDPSSGYLTVTLTKENRGEVFEDLDLLAKLLAPRKNTPVTPSIEVLSSENHDDDQLLEKTEALSLDYDEIEKGIFQNAPTKLYQLYLKRMRTTGNYPRRFHRHCLL